MLMVSVLPNFTKLIGYIKYKACYFINLDLKSWFVSLNIDRGLKENTNAIKGVSSYLTILLTLISKQE